MKFILFGRKPVSSRPDPYSGTNWLKSTLSAANGDCVEIASLTEGLIGIRDSKDTTGPVLRFTPREWDAFVGGVRNGEFDSISRKAAR